MVTPGKSQPTAAASPAAVCGVLRLTEHKSRRSVGILSLRNFDPETRTLRKHAAAATANGHDEEDDTIEKNVQGLAQAVLAADEARQAAELVSIPRANSPLYCSLFFFGWMSVGPTATATGELKTKPLTPSH